MIAYGVNFAASFFAILGMMRLMGTEGWGLFAVALQVVALTSMISDFGIGPVIMRRLALAPGRAMSILLEATSSRLLLFIPTWLLSVAVALALDSSAQFLLLVHVMLLNVLISARLPVIRGTFEAFYRSQSRMAFPTVTMAVDSLLLLAAVLVVPASFRDPVTAMMLYTGSNLIGAALLLGGSVRFARRINTEPVRVRFAGMRELVTASAPLAVYLMFNALHMSMETLYLKLFHGDAAAGIFTAATRILTPLAVFPTIIAISAAPLIAKASATNERQPQERQPQERQPQDAQDNAQDTQKIRQEDVSGDMSRLFSLGFKTLLVGSVMIAGFGVTNTRWLLDVVLGEEFRESAVPMMLLFLTFMPMALNIFLVEVNNARDRLKTNTRFAAVLALTSVLLGAVLTWQWSADGAAVAKMSAIVLGLGYLIMRSREGIAFAVKPLVWKSVLLFAVLVGLREALDPLNRWVANGAALAAVTTGIFLLRVYTAEELRQWRRQFAALLSRPG